MIIQLCALPGSGAEMFAKSLQLWMYAKLPASQRVRRLSLPEADVSDPKKLASALRTHVLDDAVVILSSPGLADQENEMLVKSIVAALAKELNRIVPLYTLVFHADTASCIANLVKGYTVGQAGEVIPGIPEADAKAMVTRALTQFNPANEEDSVPVISPSFEFQPVIWGTQAPIITPPPVALPPIPGTPPPPAEPPVTMTPPTSQTEAFHLSSTEFPSDEDWDAVWGMYKN